MAKASFTLPDGTKVFIEGSPEEIKRILSLHRPETATEEPAKKKHREKEMQARKESGEVKLLDLVETAKSSEDAELIEKNILDRSSVVDRILLPLYISHKHFSDKISLTSGDISKFLSQLGVNIFQPNVAKTLTSSASKYVIADKIRTKGKWAKYRISRRGVQYLTSVIRGKSNE